MLDEELEILKSHKFQILSHSGNKNWYNLVRDYGDFLIGCELRQNTFQLRYTINGSMQVKYMEMSNTFLGKRPFKLALRRVREVAEILVDEYDG